MINSFAESTVTFHKVASPTASFQLKSNNANFWGAILNLFKTFVSYGLELKQLQSDQTICIFFFLGNSEFARGTGASFKVKLIDNLASPHESSFDQV